MKNVKLSLLSLCVLGVLGGCGKNEATPAPKQQAAATYATQVVGQSQMAGQQQLDGVIEAVNQTVISAQTSARILSLPVDVGSKVAQGQTLVQFKDTQNRAQLSQANAMIAAAEATALDAQKNYQRLKQVFDQHLISAAQMDAATAAKNQAQAALAAARAGRGQISEQLSYNTVQAPFAGVITQRTVQVGEAVMAGQPLMTLQGTGGMRVVTDVPQQLAETLRANPSVQMSTADGQKITLGQVTVFPAADPVTHTFKVRAQLPQALQTAVHDGQLVKMWLSTGTTHNRISVAQSAVVWRGEVCGVYVLEGNAPNSLPQFRVIRLGQSQGDQVDVLSGLSRGERVVLDPKAATQARFASNVATKEGANHE